MAAAPTLKKALNQRQLRMIAIGGVIGAGLFVGSGVVIGDTGPGAFITYAMAGVLIIMVMRMLADPRGPRLPFRAGLSSLYRRSTRIAEVMSSAKR
jgi:L-asparagine transporter-like permease